LTKAVEQALKSNFNWTPGAAPNDLPQTVTANLTDALNKMAENLCVRCFAGDCAGEARIHQARGQNCLGHNCFDICRSKFFDKKFGAKAQAHALAHELMHRVITQAPGAEYYRGSTTYPPPPTIALKNADSYASLVDDLNP
jgi:hypothetical protein